MNKINYIIFEPEGDKGLCFGFATAADAEQFLEAQSGNKEWQAGWKLQRIFAHGKFHYQLSIAKYVTMTFNR